MVDQTHTQNKVPAVRAALITLPEMLVEFAISLQEIEVVIIERGWEWVLLDERSKIVIVQEDLCNERGLVVNREWKMMM